MIDEILNSAIYTEEERKQIKKAYEIAKTLHSGQFRQSGEEYIIHPLNVAYILYEMHADCDTVCAGLLHDTIEDTNFTKQNIINYFNQDVANLVDGVTKLSKMNFSSKEDQKFANTRKIITGVTEDVRIIIIKLADRLHNMRTLQYKSIYKQKKNALETMDIFVPIAYYIGAYKIKNELEDLSFKYLKPDKYKKYEDIKLRLETESKYCLTEMLIKIKNILEQQNIPNEIKMRIKNIYGIYKKMNQGYKLSDIHDLLALKIMVDDVIECYKVLYFVHLNYPPINGKFKDYICNPKTNMYQSLHTTVFGIEDKIVQTQIRTFDMENIANNGLATYFDINKGSARNIMQEDLKKKYQFFKSLTEMNKVFGDNREFVNQVKSELFSKKIYVYTPRGDVIELPNNATPIDFAYKIHTDLGNTMIGVVVNDEYVSFDYKLKNKDRVRIITDELSNPKEEWLDIAQTTHAKRKIKQFLHNV